MTAVETGDDDISPWARDDWTSSGDSLPPQPPTPPERDAVTPSLTPLPDRLPAHDGPSRARVLLAGAVGIGLVVFGAVAVIRGGDSAADPATTTDTREGTVQTSSTTTPVLPPPATTTEVVTTVADDAGAAPAVVGEIPAWTESTVAVPPPLDGLTAPTEVVTVTDNLVLQRIDVPSGRVRSLDLAEWGANLRIALSDDSIAVYDSRYVAIIRGDEAIRLFEIPEGVLFLEAWPGTNSFVVTSPGSPTGEPERFVMSADDGSLQPVTPDVTDALLFGAGNFLSNGDLLVNRPGGIYAIGPDQQARRIDEGALLAVGRNHYAVERCDESLQCTQFVVEAATGATTPAVLDDLNGLGVVDPSTRIAPDGRSIVGTDPTRDTGYRQIIDTVTGSRTDIGRLAALYYPDPWAADGSGLFTDAAGALRFQVRDTAEVVTIDGLGVIESLTVRPAIVDP
jgi:hypothetical protein